MDVDDRRGAELDEALLALDRAGRQQRGGRRWGHREDHGIGLDGATVGDHTPTGRCFRQLTNLHAGTDIRPEVGELRGSGVAVKPLERDVSPADVPGVRPLEQTGTHNRGGETERRRVRRGVEGRDGQELPQRLDGCRGLALAGQPATERGTVDLGSVRVEPTEPVGRERRP